MGKTDLIKTVRGLDQIGPGEKGENLEVLWKNLTESSDDQFHAAEESALRWLLKSMNGSSQGAETLRRYPLTWTILNCVFQRIPLFSLAKSLADRRFVSVLQQTLKDISKPIQESGSPGAKRKRSPAPRYDLDELKGLEGCLATGQAVFNLLRSLLASIDGKVAGSRDRIGAEHIRSLFCTSAAEAATIASSALTICNLLLKSDNCDDIEGRENWITTITAIWGLHLQGPDDTLEVATHLFKPAAGILGKVETFSQAKRENVSDALAARWSSDLQKFMHRNLILPARTAFLHRQDFEPITRALEISVDKAAVSSPALYFLSAGASDLENERDMRRSNATWMKQIFQAVEQKLRREPGRNALMAHMIGQATQKSISIDVEDLHVVCRGYGLKDEGTDWSLIAKAAVCNPDIFQVSDEGRSLLEEVCGRSVKRSGVEGEDGAISDLIGAIQKSFCTRRNFSGFLKLWFAQLCSVEQRKLASRHPWFELGRKSDSPSTLIESELSSRQLLEVVEWLEGQELDSHPQAVCLFSDAVARGLKSESFIDSIGTKLFDLTSRLTKSDTTALKWRVVSKTISWVSRDERSKIWAQVKDELSKILRKKPIQSAETFEALKCCYQVWDAMSQDGEVADEPATLVEKFTSRLVKEIASQDILEITKLSACLDLEASSEFHEEHALQQYLAWYLLGSSRFLRLYSARKGEIPSVVETVLSTKASTDGLCALWDMLMRNDVNLNDTKLSRNLLDRLITALADTEKEKGWPGEQGRMWIQTLSSIPVEVFTRQQREQTMTILEKRRAKMVKSSKKVSLEGWKLVIDLSTKMMSRSTFYEGLQFANLVEVADALSEFPFEDATGDEALLELVERFFAMASATIKQMSENNEERSIKYFTESLQYISNCDPERSGDGESSRIPPFRITLLKALAAELSKSSTFQNHADLSHLPQNAKTVLAKRIVSVLGEFMADKKLLAKHETAVDLSLFAAVNAASAVDDVAGLSTHKSSAVRKLEKRSKESMDDGDLRGWKIHIFLQTYLANNLGTPRPVRFASLDKLPSKARESLLKEYVASIIKHMETPTMAQYLADLISEFTGGCDTNGQILTIQHVVGQLIERTDLHGKGEGVDLAAAHSELAFSLLKKSPNTVNTCRVLQTLLEKKPQAMSQWNIEITLSTISDLALSKARDASTVPFTWLCKLAGTIIKKHRLRLEGHYHLLLTTMQALLCSLVNQAPHPAADGVTQESMAHLYGRLLTLICEPSAGAVSRSQHQSALDSATDAAKRSAGRHMYLVLMQYVKLQLEASVAREVREALEPAMNTIFDITPPEVRKILNDAMDGSGRAILREMFKRYVKFGKWSGV
ncbi:Nucleolar pre-ribosomal-associated 2-like protein [Cladobotryum mycophilum]|uniref:Nucleolar pre-ribosomal-associated 2-like protein n=1 Tax=Cladobotryum mycophilum TaxID=491253 RepID=A0ABR0SE65_9HYPO